MIVLLSSYNRHTATLRTKLGKQNYPIFAASKVIPMGNIICCVVAIELYGI